MKVILTETFRKQLRKLDAAISNTAMDGIVQE